MGERAGRLLKRRGLLAGAAALVTAAIAKVAGTGGAHAGHDTAAPYSPTNVLHLGLINDGGNAANDESTTSLAARTVLLATGGGVFRARNLTTSGTNNSSAVEGVANGFGLIGRQTGTIFNHSTFGLAAGVAGVSETSGSGVVGRSTTGAGVRGLSNEGQGILGMARTAGIDSASGPSQKAGVAGVGVGSVGVLAISDTESGVSGTSGAGFGVRALSTSNVGVYAESVSNTAAFAAGPRGVWGRTTGGIGVLAQATQGGTVENRSFGIYAAAPGPGWAGYFEGNVYVTGQVFTGGASAATSSVPAADGSARTLYSVDSAEPLVEDVGEGKLANGRAEVRLDPDFAAVADGANYQVFLTEYGDLGGTYVAARTPNGFEVRSRTGAAGAFGYRVVAKRKGGGGKRLEKVERPRGLSPKDLEPPTPPKPDTGSRREAPDAP